MIPRRPRLAALKERGDREQALREHRRLDDNSLLELRAAPQQIYDLDPRLAPLYHYQIGLAALALLDGDIRIGEASTAFTRFRRALGKRAEEERDAPSRADSERTPGFHTWVEIQVDRRVFPRVEDDRDRTISPEDVRALDAEWQQRRSAAEEIEELFSSRCQLAGV